MRPGLKIYHVPPSFQQYFVFVGGLAHISCCSAGTTFYLDLLRDYRLLLTLILVGSWDHMWCQGSYPGLPHARQVPYLLQLCLSSYHLPQGTTFSSLDYSSFAQTLPFKVSFFLYVEFFYSVLILSLWNVITYGNKSYFFLSCYGGMSRTGLWHIASAQEILLTSRRNLSKYPKDWVCAAWGIMNSQQKFNVVGALYKEVCR